MLSIPDKTDLLIFFEGEPENNIQEDSIFAYKSSDHSGVNLEFSFDIIAASIQIRLAVIDRPILEFVQENANEISIEEDSNGEYLRCRFDLRDAISEAKIYLRPEINVYWHVLVA